MHREQQRDLPRPLTTALVWTACAAFLVIVWGALIGAVLSYS